MKVSRPVRRGDCGKVPGIQQDAWQLAAFPPYLNTSLIRVGEVFREAVKVNAAGLIVVHNHPSGDPSPSPEDVAVTRALIEAGKLLDVDVLDHLVIGRHRFVSLKERGLGFS